MGKARRQKKHGAAARNTADSSTAVSSHETSAANGGQASGDQMDMKAGVLDGLTSLNALTREASCAAIASLFEKIDSPEAGNDSWLAAQRLIAGGLVKKLLPRMVDRAPEVKLQATGAMRNISAVRDPRVCEIMVNDDCLTPVLTLLDRMSTVDAAAATAAAASAASPTASVPPTAAQTEVTMRLKQETVVIAQLVATLCNLLAAVDVAVGRFTKQGGLQVVMRLLNLEGCRGSAEVFGGALQALHVATDSNVDLALQLAAFPGAVDQLSALVRGADVAHVKVSTAMRVQAAGVLVNVAGLSTEMATAESPEAQAELGRLVLPLLLEQMVYDPAVLQQACVALAAAASPAATKPTAKSADAESMDVDAGGAAAVDGNGACDIGVAGDEGKGGAMGNAEAAAAAGAQVVAAVAASTPMQVVTSEIVHGGGKAVSEGNPGVVAGEESEGKQGGGGEEAVVEQPDMDAQVRWEWKVAVAEPLKLTAEVLTNLCALAVGEEGDGDEDEEEWGSDDEDAMEQAASGNGTGQGQSANGQAAGAAGGSSVVLVDAMVERGALPRTIAALKALLSRTPRDDRQQQSTGVVGRGAAGTPTPTAEVGATPPRSDRLPLPAGTAGDLADLRATVALCAANLVQNLPPKALGQEPHALWTELCGMCEAAMERAPSCVETLTGVMWGLARRAGPAVAAGIRFSAATATTPGAVAADPASATDPLPLLLCLCNPETTRAFEARVNAVGMLGALGSATAVGDGPSEAARRVHVSFGRALVQAMEDPHVLVQAEALNAMMDVYGEDGRDAAFRETGAPAALAAGVPAFRRKVKQEGTVLGRDALCHLKETALNASRFVKYKKIAVEGRGSSGR